MTKTALIPGLFFDVTLPSYDQYMICGILVRTMSKFDTVIISNRLPVSVAKKDGKLVYEASSGGLATAMSSLEADNKIWVGWPGIDAETLSDDERESITHTLREQGCYPVFLTAKEVELYYEGYANDTLWPLFHYFH